MSYAKLMDPFSLSNELRETIDYNFSCIHKYPEKINDYGTPSYYINQNPDLIMKDGSRGVICMAIKSMKLGIAVKLEDGWTDEYQGMIIANILEQLKYENTELIEKLKNCYTTKLFNDCGIEVKLAHETFLIKILDTKHRNTSLMKWFMLHLPSSPLWTGGGRMAVLPGSGNACTACVPAALVLY